MSDFYDHRDNWYRIELDLNEHKNDAVKHITNTERQNWNAKSDAHDHPYAPLSHVGDATHVTSSEKSTWNGKATASDIASAINTHKTSVVHGYLVPNWSSVSVIKSNTYTPSSPGIVYITYNLNATYGIHVLVNGVQIGQFLDDGPDVGFASIHLNSGDTLTLDWSVQGEEIPFYNSLPSDDNISGHEGYGVYAIFVPFKTV